MGQTTQAAAGIQPAQQAQNPILQAMAAQQIQGAMTKANLDMMRQIMADREMSGFDKFMGSALPIAGGVAGGMMGGLPGASAGMGMGSGLSGLLTSY